MLRTSILDGLCGVGLDGLGARLFGSWSPLLLPLLVLWFKADLGVLNASGAVASPGDAVKTWQDQSGLGNHAVQVTVAKQPLFSVSPAKVTFDGSNDLLLLTNSAVVSEYFVVWRSVQTNLNNYGAPLEYATANDGAHYMGVMQPGVNQQFIPNLPRFVRKDRVALSGSFNVAPVSTRMLMTVGTQNPTDNRAMQMAGLGQSFWQNIEINEVIGVSSDLSTANRDLTEAYLRTKWGTP